MTEGIFKRWPFRRLRPRNFTPEELTLVRELLPPNDPRSGKLFRQAETAKDIQRYIDCDGKLVVAIPYLADSNLRVQCGRDADSPEYTAVEPSTGRRFAFSIHVSRGGILTQLMVRSVDNGAWQTSCQLPPGICSAHTLESRDDWLPAQVSDGDRTSILTSLAEWAHTSAANLLHFDRDLLWVYMPATIESIENTQRRLSLTLPDEIIEFLIITDGVSILRGRAYELLGTDDVYCIGDSGTDFVVTPLYEEGAVVVETSGSEEGTAFLRHISGGSRIRIGTFRDHVRESLEWRVD